ncbi:MAG: hypothetical protein ABIV50_07175, partial [Opitutus sp.]
MAGRSEKVTARSAPGVVSGSIGGALLALAGHLALLSAYGTPLPYRDQWKCTAVDLLQPWVNGELTWRNFFEPLNDHWPVLTRALSFLLVQLNGQWSNSLETAVNALLFAACVGIFLRVILPSLSGWARPAFALITGTVCALPVTWENTLWGIQSLVYLQVLLTLLYLLSVTHVRDFSIRWWLGQFSGLLLLFTQHSAILAHVAVAMILTWRYWRRDGDRRVNGAAVGFALAAITLFAAFFPSLQTTAALRADSLPVAIEVFLRQLAYPLPHPAWAFFVYLPWLIWAVDRFTTRRMGNADAFILAAGLWVGAQAAAIGYGRGAATFTFVSRYCDFLALGFLLNAACLVRLGSTYYSRRLHVALGLFGAIWLLAPIKSFWWESTESHAGYNLSRRPAENARNIAGVRTYLISGDASLISDDQGRGLYSYPPEIVRLLDDPKFRALLIPETGAAEARRDGGRLARLSNQLLAGRHLFAAAGVLLLLASAYAVYRRPGINVERVLEQGHVTRKGVAMLFGLVGLSSVVVLLAWPYPSVVTRSARLRQLFVPERSDLTSTELSFHRADGNERGAFDARGATETSPIDAREFTYGTRRPSTPDFRGIIHSQPIRITSGFLIAPFSGYPCADGNGLRWRLFNPSTTEEKYLSYLGPNPGGAWQIWSTNVSEYRDWEASVYLYDGREDETGWVGVGVPIQTNDPTWPAQWLALLKLERTDPAHATVAGLAV